MPARNPAAVLIGLDASEEMLARAREALPDEDAELRAWRLIHPLPSGPFDVVFSALTVHHLDAAGKADLLRRVAAALSPGGRFVLGDVVVPEDPSDAVTPIDLGYDKPSPVPDQLGWLAAAGLRPASPGHTATSRSWWATHPADSLGPQPCPVRPRSRLRDRVGREPSMSLRPRGEISRAPT